MSNKRAPLVTGISPKEGPPGTRVTIRGENLGLQINDLIGLRICGVDCLLSAEWKSPNKIIARTGQTKGKGEIIVSTMSGGAGSCTVQFKGYFVQTGPLQDSAVWVDESQTWMNLISRNRATPMMMSPEHDDPLGISDESNDTKFPDDLGEMFPEGSGDTSQEHFEPAWFLLENHHGTSFDDLKAGLAYLKRKSSQRNEGPLAFVKANLTTFMDCQDTLLDMHQKMDEDKEGTTDGNITFALEEVLLRSNKSADLLFQDVLGRKDRADATRNALGVLHRFKFLFNLPCSIDRNIKKGDYDLVITDYTRARSLFGEVEIPVFKKMYAEVENRIENFRDMLYKKLLQLPSSLDEQKRLIRYLVYLESPGDPAWECLVHMQRWLLTLLYNCKDQHIAKDREPEQPDSGEDRVEIRSPKRISTGIIGQPVMRDNSFKSGTKAPQKVVFVEDLTKILIDHLPDLWRLGQAYFSGKLLKEAKDRGGRMDSNRHTQFKKMILEVIMRFSQLIRAAFLPQSLENLHPVERERLGSWKENKKDSPIAWLPICVRVIRTSVSSLSNFELSSDSMEMLQELAFDMRTNCMSTLLKQSIEDIKGLHSREMWVVESDDERGGTTQLPALFENLVSETVQHLHEVLQARVGESEIFSQVPIQKEAIQLCIQVLQSFAATLEQLAIIGNVERPTKNVRAALNPDLFSSGEAGGMPPLDHRLLIMLSNCHYTREVILPRLVENLRKHDYPETDKVLQVASQTYVKLDEDLFDRFLEEKSNPIVGALEQNMYAGHFDWNDCLQSIGVRRYLKDAIMGMIEVHAEVYSVSPHIVERVMCRVIEGVVDELARLIQCVTGFSKNGALQARIELYALEIAVHAYSTDNTVAAFREATECLPAIKTPDDKKLLEDLLNQFQSQMRFQLMCFQPDNKTSESHC